MKLREIKVHNYRSIVDATVLLSDYTLLIGPNNCGKSNLINAIRAFYDDLKWVSDDWPKVGATDAESWIELKFGLNDNEWDNLADKYKIPNGTKELQVRRYFKSDNKKRVQSGQSNIFGYVNGALDEELFYGAKNVSAAKLGEVIYVPALTTPAEQTKMTGPSPLRNMLNYLIKRVVSKSPAYATLVDAFQQLNDEAKGKDGFLSEVANPLNKAIDHWKIKIDIGVNPVEAEDITKNLVSFAFIDSALGGDGFQLDRYGHGFQRSVIYELIRLAPSFREQKKLEKKEFSPEYALILFEEPEAFLHPSQQENMAYHLRRLGSDSVQQVLITTHSSTFVGKAAEEMAQLARIRKDGGLTSVCQPNVAEIRAIFQDGGELLRALQAYVADPAVPQNLKGKAQAMIANPPQNQIAEDEERFRFQLWLDGERAALFFADKVLLVEGASERALFNYLLANEWHDLSVHRINVVDVLGKFNFHRFIALMKAYKIPYGVMLDDDNNAQHQGAVNNLIDRAATGPILAPPEKFQGCLEAFLGLPALPDRSDKKPLEVMKAITSGAISQNVRNGLRGKFMRALAIS
jgi:AAA15 family ATPase/GTPase